MDTWIDKVTVIRTSFMQDIENNQWISNSLKPSDAYMRQ